MAEGTKAPRHLWVIGVLSLLWNSIGGFSYTMTRLGKLADLGMGAEEITYFESHPMWANTFWALGVWGAIIGSILLLAGSRHAATAFVVALIGLVGSTFYQYGMSDIPDSLRSPALSIMIWVTTVLLLWYSLRQKSAGVLR